MTVTPPTPTVVLFASPTGTLYLGQTNTFVIVGNSFDPATCVVTISDARANVYSPILVLTGSTSISLAISFDLELKQPTSGMPPVPNKRTPEEREEVLTVQVTVTVTNNPGGGGLPSRPVTLPIRILPSTVV
jgi:hypothetical protein